MIPVFSGIGIGIIDIWFTVRKLNFAGIGILIGIKNFLKMMKIRFRHRFRSRSHNTSSPYGPPPQKPGFLRPIFHLCAFSCCFKKGVGPQRRHDDERRRSRQFNIYCAVAVSFNSAVHHIPSSPAFKLRHLDQRPLSPLFPLNLYPSPKNFSRRKL